MHVVGVVVRSLCGYSTLGYFDHSDIMAKLARSQGGHNMWSLLYTHVFYAFAFETSKGLETFRTFSLVFKCSKPDLAQADYHYFTMMWEG